MLRTENASKKEAYTEVERVVVCHGLGDVALKCLTLGVLGDHAWGMRTFFGLWSLWSCRVVNAF